MGCGAENRIERIRLDNIPVFSLVSAILLLLISQTTLASPRDDDHHQHHRRAGQEVSTASQQRSAPGTFVRYYKLHSRCSGRHVSVKGSLVQARARPDSKYAWLRIESLGSKKGVLIRSNASHSYLCFTINGSLTVKHRVGRKNHAAMNRCSFDEVLTSTDYIQFRSKNNSDWFVGFNRNGGRLPGNRRAKSSKNKNLSEDAKMCFQFLPTDTRPNPHRSSGVWRVGGGSRVERSPNGSWVPPWPPRAAAAGGGGSSSRGTVVVNGDGTWYEEQTTRRPTRHGKRSRQRFRSRKPI